MDRDSAARALFRRHGFTVESVSWIRAQQEGEFMAILCWPADDVADVVEFITMPKNTSVHITRIHLGRELPPANGPDGSPRRYRARVFVAWDHVPQPTMTWDEMNEAVRKHLSR